MTEGDLSQGFTLPAQRTDSFMSIPKDGTLEQSLFHTEESRGRRKIHGM